MVAVKHAMIDLPLTEDSARYIGLLEKQVAVLTLSSLRQRCLLELLTDTSWDDEHFTAEDAEIRKIAQKTLSKRLGITAQEAKRLVDERWERYQGPRPPKQSARKGVAFLADGSDMASGADDDPKTRVVSQAVPTEVPQPFDARAAVLGYKQRRGTLLPDREGVVSEDVSPES